MRTRTRTTLAGLVLAAALVGGVAWAMIPGNDGTIQGCYTTSNGNLRVVESAADCRNSETAISWNQQGQRGAAGAAGANGADGRDGAPGAKGEPCLSSDPACRGPKGDPGTNGTDGTNGTNGAPGAKGDPCLSSDPACRGPKGDPGTDGTDGKDGAPGAQGPVGPQGPPGSGSGGLASLDALGGVACNAAGTPGSIQVTYGPPPGGAVTLACKPTSTPTLTVLRSLTGTGENTVTSDVGGISCGATCSQSYPYGTVVTLTASSAIDVFTGWSGACSGTGACVVTMNAAASVTANFVPGVTVTVNQSGGMSGTTCTPTSTFCSTWSTTASVSSTPAGLSCVYTRRFNSGTVTGATCAQRFEAGITIVLTSGSEGPEVTWGGACASATGRTCTLALNSDKTVTASYPTS